MNYLLVVQVFVRTPLSDLPAQFCVETSSQAQMALTGNFAFNPATEERTFCIATPKSNCC